jgi:hypothetical protein
MSAQEQNARIKNPDFSKIEISKTIKLFCHDFLQSLIHLTQKNISLVFQFNLKRTPILLIFIPYYVVYY